MDPLDTTFEMAENRGQANLTRSEENQLITSGTDPGGTSNTTQSEASKRPRNDSAERLREHFRKNPKCRRRPSQDNPDPIRFGPAELCMSHESRDEDAIDGIGHPTDELCRVGSAAVGSRPARVGDPTEYPHDMDFAEDVSTSDSDGELEEQIERNDLYRHENLSANVETPASNPGELIVPGRARINGDIIVNGSNETNITGGLQANSTDASKPTSSEAADNGAEVGTSTDDVNDDTVPLNRSIPKPSAVTDDGKRSAERIDQ